MSGPAAPPPLSTTFILLKPSNGKPNIVNASDPAGEAFNRTLRKIADLPQFHSQLFGWRDVAVSSDLLLSAGTDVLKEGELVWDPQYVGWRKPGQYELQNGLAQDFLILVINWEALPSPALHGEIEQLLEDMASVFELPHTETDITSDILPSRIISVRWSEGGPKRILNRTLRPIELAISSKQTDGAVDTVDAVAVDNEDMATGSLIQPDSLGSEHNGETLVVLRSVPDNSKADAVNESSAGRLHVVFRTSLTRTRWCTKIKEDLMATITARRID